MKTIIKIIIINILFTNNMYCQNSVQEAKSTQKVNLYDFIGLNISSNTVQNYFKTLGEFKVRKFTDDISDYYFLNYGIQFRIEKSGDISAIFCHNKDVNNIYSPIAFKGEIPFGINFKNNLSEIENILGKGSIVHRYGFYGRVLQWKINNNLKMSMEIELSRNENDGSIFIEWISLSKVE